MTSLRDGVQPSSRQAARVPPGKVLSVKPADYDLPAFQRAHNPTLWVDLANDTDTTRRTLLGRSRL